MVSSEENIQNIEKLRINNLRRSGLIDGKVIKNDIVVLWLSYNVHGNEANSTETAMKVIYNLLASEDNQFDDWLKKLIIIIDPCLNPDGRERYVNWYNQVSNLAPNPGINSREHHEEWTSGRTNHYLFDLNRDWVWQTQIESKARLQVYNKWMPQVHVDFHEQFPNSEYYFAPAAEPMHEQITSWQKEFQGIIGKNNAKYFDEKGWLYFTRESFDLLYPGYGDTYPTFNGAIGMTYEMPGHGIAGLSIETVKGDTLNLSERIDMHYTTSISTIEACYENREALLVEFSKYFSEYAKDIGSYILKSDNPDKIRLLTDLLDKNKIIYKSAKIVKKPRIIKALSYKKNQLINIGINKNDLIIPINQPKSRLIQVLFERNTKLADSLTYDITAWSLPYVYGLEAYKTGESIEFDNYQIEIDEIHEEDEHVYAYVLNWTSILDARFLSDILQKGYKVNYASKAFEFNNSSFSSGSLIINRIDNPFTNFEHDLVEIAKLHQRKLIPLFSGSSISAFDLGSQKVKYLSKQKIAILAGGDVSSYNFGELWYFFEQEINYQVDIITLKWLKNVDYNLYDVFILPSGKYESFEDEDSFKKIEKWVSQGGTLILIEDAIKRFTGESKFSLEKLTEDEKDKNVDPVLFPYEIAKRERLRKSIIGGIIQLEIDNSHPLAYGYNKSYHTLKNHNNSYKLLEDGWNVGYIKSSNNALAGFVGSKIKGSLDKNLVFGVEQKSKGKIIYFVDNPVFRGFWQNGKLFLANAVFFNN